jgi:hypothetical protein
VPAAAVIPAPIAYIKVVAFKTLVVEVCSRVWYICTVCAVGGAYWRLVCGNTYVKRCVCHKTTPVTVPFTHYYCLQQADAFHRVQSFVVGMLL